MQPDMSAQYTRELYHIARELRAIDVAMDRIARDASRAHRKIERLLDHCDRHDLTPAQMRRAILLCSRASKSVARICRRDADAMRRTRERLIRRQQILRGRLGA